MCGVAGRPSHRGSAGYTRLDDGFFSLFLACQFPDIVEFCEEMANAGKTVIVAALDGTFQRKVYPILVKLGAIVTFAMLCLSL